MIAVSMKHDSITLVSRGLDHQSPPMRLFEEQTVLRRLTSPFQAGKEAVTLGLHPLIMTIAQKGRAEES
jgi:hypothetical protein